MLVVFKKRCLNHLNCSTSHRCVGELDVWRKFSFLFTYLLCSMFYRSFRRIMQFTPILLYNKKASTGAIRSKLVKALNFHLFKRDSAACSTQFRRIASCFSSICTNFSRRRLFYSYLEKKKI